MTDKRELLRSLSIERPVEPPVMGASSSRPGLPVWVKGVGLVGLVAISAAAGVYGPGLFGGAGGVASTTTSASNSASKPAAGDSGTATASSSLKSGSASGSAATPRPTNTLVASGYIVARRTATVSAEITGRVQDVLVDEGMVVTKGQELARLDSTLAGIDLDLSKARVLSAQAQIEGLSADLRDAERVLVRTASLSKASNVSEAELTRTQARAETLRAQLKGAKADLEVARISVVRQTETVDRHIVRAPFDGVVIDKNAQPGEIISPMSSGGFTRTGVCTLVDMDSLEVEVDVNEANIGRVRAGQTVEAVLDAYPDWKIPASVIAVVPRANRDKATIKVRIKLEQRDGRILPDMGAKVTFLDARPAGN